MISLSLLPMSSRGMTTHHAHTFSPHVTRRSYPYSQGLLLLICLLLVLTACGTPAAPAPGPATQSKPQQQQALQRVKQTIQEELQQLKSNATTLKTASSNYYEQAKAVQFNYTALGGTQHDQVLAHLTQARRAWVEASAAYHQAQGIVAQVNSLNQYDVLLASGIVGNGSGADDNAVGANQGVVAPYDLTLPNGRVVQTPGALFEVLEGSLWTVNPLIATHVGFHDGTTRPPIGNELPDANLLKAASDTFESTIDQLIGAVDRWQPTLSDVFSALVFDLDSVQTLFSTWENAMFGGDHLILSFDQTVHSLLIDFSDSITGWQKIATAMHPLLHAVHSSSETTISTGLQSLQDSINAIHRQEVIGKPLTIEQEDVQRSQLTRKANSINDAIAQVAETLKVMIQQ